MIQYIESRLEDFRRELDNTTDSYHAEYLTGVIEAHEHLLEAAKTQTSWVTADGSYGQGAFLTFRPNDLTDEQWSNLGEIHDNTRLDYALALLYGDTKTATQIEEDYLG